MRGTGYLLALALLSGGSAFAYSNTEFNKRLADEARAFTQADIDKMAGGLKPPGGGISQTGSPLSKTLPKIGKYIKFGPNVFFAASMVNDALVWLYEEAKESSGHAGLDGWWKSATKFKPATYFLGNPAQYGVKEVEYVCAVYTEPAYGMPGRWNFYHMGKDGSGNITYWVTGHTDDGQQFYTADSNAKFKCTELDTTEPPSLGEYMRTTPDVAAAVANVLGRYTSFAPDKARPTITVAPVPNTNEEADDVLDPGLDTDGDGVKDGDELRRGPGVVTIPGNRPHIGDGVETDPTDADSKPIDTDGDTIPDWRDADDDGDGVKDDEETLEGQKDKTKVPDSYLDTDGDGIKDDLDQDDDNDGATDAEEEAAGTDSKDPQSKPKEEEITCPEGQVKGEDGKCAPEEEEETCPEGQVKGEDGKCIPNDEDGPVDDDCGMFTLARLTQHTIGYVRDVIFPCESPKDIFKPVLEVAKGKYPFALVSGLNNMVSASGSAGDRSAVLPNKLGPFTFDWAWISPLLLTISLLFKGFTTWVAVDIVLSRLTGQLVIK